MGHSGSRSRRDGRFPRADAAMTSVYVRVCVFVFMKLRITTQSYTLVLLIAILYHSH